MLKITYVNHMGDDLTVVNAARVSFGKESEELSESDKKLINYLAKHEHMSPFEHCTATVLVECPLYIRSQIHRHRTFAYNEVSRRYTGDGIEFYLPSVDDVRAQSVSNRQASDGVLDEEKSQQIIDLMDEFHYDAKVLYEKLLRMGVCREQARGVLPQNLMTKFYMTGNLRNFAHFIKLRTHIGAQKEVRDLAEQLKAILAGLFPNAMEALFSNM